ncbi:phage minor capsid protein [Streptomyces sp. NPDC004250]|uniref:phage minor capsid protein n=1 Tax=Streptomyces sp. NPDC004250 TaxID=3364692 RepID=UPI00367E99B3
MAEDLASAVAALYEQAELALIERVTRALAEGLDSPLWVELKLAAVGNLRAAIEEIIAVLQVDASGAMHQALAEAYDRGQQAAIAELGAVAVGPALAAAEAVPAAAAVDRLAAALVGETGPVHARILRTGMDVYRQVIAEATSAPLLGGETRRQAAARALAKFAERGVTGFVDNRGRAWSMTTYAEMATRSAVGRAAVQAHTDRLAAAGIDLVVVSDAPEECPRCKPWEGKVLRREGPSGAGVEEMEHATEDGRMVRVRVSGSLPEARAAGLMHPNCFPGGVLVSSPSEVLAADARRYEGEVVVIHTASGVELPVTPNHPVLTPEGWVPAGALKVGDHVLRHSGDVETSPLRAPGDHEIPARISEVFDALRETSQVPPVRVPVAAEQFHGDGLGSDVEVVLADGLLGDGGDTERSEVRGEDALLVGGVGLGPLFSERAPFEVIDGTGHAAHRCMGRGDLGSALFGSHSLPLPAFGLTEVGSVAAGQEHPTHGGLSAPEAPADLGLTDSIKVQSDGLIDPGAIPGPRDSSLAKLPVQSAGVDANGGRDLAGTLASQVSADDVVHIELRQFAGHVYNLQTGDGWYLAEGIVVHNCRHSISIYLPGLTRSPGPKKARSRATYEQSQQQRYLERQVRAWKRRAAGALDDDKRRRANAQVRDYQGRIRELVADTGLPRKSHREQIDVEARPATAERPARPARPAVR